MTTYATGNPVPSTEVKDLYDNAQNLDTLINDRTKLMHPDRLGAPRKTWFGVETQAQLDIATAVAEATAQAETARDGAYVAEAGAEAARDAAIAAAGSIGPLEFFPTHAAAAEAAAGGLADGVIVEVATDETRDGARTRYRVESGALVFEVNLDVLRIDLAAPDGLGRIGAFETYAALRAAPSTEKTVQVLDSAGGGVWELVPGDTITPDNGVTWLVDAAGNRRRRTGDLSTIKAQWAGAKADGVTDNTAAFALLAASGGKDIELGSGVYRFASAPNWSAFEGVNFIGRGRASTKLNWAAGSFALRSPKGVTFQDLCFSADKSDSIYTDMFASNFQGIGFYNCDFEGFGGNTVNKAGSGCIYMLCSDTSSATVDAGSSKGALFWNCHFKGAGRFTNFAIRIHNGAFIGVTADISDVKVIGCTFDEFNWNAVELAGTTVHNNIVEACVFNSCGLCPIDIDKGAHTNTVANCIVNRLLGNIDKVANPNTRAVVASVQGITPSSGYAYNNTVKNIVAYLRKTDLDTYGNGCVAASVAYAHSNVIDGVLAYCDGVPVRGAGQRFGFACVSFETASNNEIRNIKTTNASCGIVQTAAQNSGMTSRQPNVFENIKNNGTMTEEPIQITGAASAGAFSRNIIRDVDFSSDLSNAFFTSYTNRYAVLAVASGSSGHFLKLVDSTLELPAGAGLWFVMDQIPLLSLDNVTLIDNGTLASTRFVHSEGSTVPDAFGISNVFHNFGQFPIDLTSALASLDPTAAVVGQISDRGFTKRAPTTLFAASTPTAPAAANWDPNIRVERLTKAANSFLGWTSVTSAWKTYGSVSA